MNLKKLANEIKQYRQQNKITQNDLAKMLGVSRSTLSNYENGIMEPSISFVYNFAKLSNISIDDLIDDRNNQFFSTLSPLEKNLLNERRDIEYMVYLEQNKYFLEKLKTNCFNLEKSKLKMDETYLEFKSTFSRTNKILEDLEITKRNLKSALEDLINSKERLDTIYETLLNSHNDDENITKLYENLTNVIKPKK
ncbi:TPA: helix-turn-helix transcriptional regulator [Clostridium perfringens]|nr:helix-turn-helix transcriptional regulator [Clostridium perfringens]HAT4321458.1 helix-turn-helix transcriptional regulator [Clostridium perfringens]